MPAHADKTFLVLSATFPPDAPAVGQHMADVGEAMASRGWRVVAVASERAYDDPSRRFPRRERLRGMEVIRVPLASFGKGSLAARAVGMAFFLAQALRHALFTPRLGAIIVSTSPPLCGLVAACARLVRGVPYTYWMMDLNPDQAVALGKVRAGSALVRTFDALQKFILRHASAVVVLDRFMAERLRRKFDPGRRLRVIPPWAHEEPEESLAHERNAFRAEHVPPGAFCVMYSGNHGYSTPVAEIMGAADLLGRGDAEDRRAVFMFVGGGVRKAEVDARAGRAGAENVRSLPYQPLERLRESLSAADVHLVTMDAHVVGMVHPCKIYGAMGVGRPVLLVGPPECHAADILNEGDVGWRAEGASAGQIAEAVRAAMRTPASRREEMGRRARGLVAARYARAASLGALCDEIESTVRDGAGETAPPQAAPAENRP